MVLVSAVQRSESALCMHAQSLQSCQLCVTLWAVARQSPLYLGFSRQEYWSGLPFPPPGDLPHLELKSTSLTSPALTGWFFTTSTTWETLPMQVSTEHWVEFPVLYRRFLLVIYFFLINSVSVSTPIYQLIPSSLPLLVCSLRLCLYFCFANKIIYTIFLDFTLALIPLPPEVKLFLTSWKTLSLLSYVLVALFFFSSKRRQGIKLTVASIYWVLLSHALGS